MKQPRVIILVFSGEEPDRQAIAEISGIVGVACEAEELQQFVLDSKDLAVASLHGIKNLMTAGKKETPNQCKTPEDNAAVFIGVKMKQVLGADYSPMLLMTNLVKEMANAKKRPNNQMNKEFMNALFILSQPDLNIGKEILKETNLDDDKIAVIRDTYNLMKSHE